MIEATLMICFTACTMAVTLILWILIRLESVKGLEGKIEDLQADVEKRFDSIESRMATLIDPVSDGKEGEG